MLYLAHLSERERLDTAETTASNSRTDDHHEDLAELENSLADAIVELDERWALAAEATTVQQAPLEKNDINVRQLALVWVPVLRRGGCTVASAPVTSG